MGRSRRFALYTERQLCEPLLTKLLEAAERRYVPFADKIKFAGVHIYTKFRAGLA